MKFLQAAVLSAVCVEYVTASTFKRTSFHDAIDDEGDFGAYKEFCEKNDRLQFVGIIYVTETKPSNFIINFIKRTKPIKWVTLVSLWRHSSIETVEKVLKEIDFSQDDLVRAAGSQDLIYLPEKFVDLLGRIEKVEDQEKVVEEAIEKLVNSSTETSPLLNALKDKTFRSERLESLAIQKAFMEGVKSGRVSFLPEDICEDAAITPELYADALIVTARWQSDNTMRQFLLKNADRSDLQAVKGKAGYADLDSEFRYYIEEALKTAAPGGTRQHRYLLVQSAKIAKETFDEITGKEFPGITDITGSFLTGRPTTRERAKAVRQTIGEVTMTRTPEPTKEIGDILGAYVGEDEE